MSENAIDLLNKTVIRCNIVISDHPESGFIDDALLLRSKAQYHLGQLSGALNSIRILESKFPESALLLEASLWKIRFDWKSVIENSALSKTLIFLSNLDKDEKSKNYKKMAADILNTKWLTEENSNLEEQFAQIHNSILEAVINNTKISKGRTRNYLKEKEKQILVQKRIERLEGIKAKNKKVDDDIRRFKKTLEELHREERKKINEETKNWLLDCETNVFKQLKSGRPQGSIAIRTTRHPETKILVNDTKEVAEIFAEYFDGNQNLEETKGKNITSLEEVTCKYRKRHIKGFTVTEARLDKAIKSLKSSNTKDPYGMTNNLIKKAYPSIKN